MEDQQYHYHIEDGQFTIDYYSDKLVGYEGLTIELDLHESGRFHDVYILHIDMKNKYIECIGNVERSFPKNRIEHNRALEAFLSYYQEEGEDDEEDLDFNDGILEYDDR